MKKVIIEVEDNQLATLVSIIAATSFSFEVHTLAAEGEYIHPSLIQEMDDSPRLDPVVRAKVRRARTQHAKRQQRSAPPPVTTPDTRREAIMRVLRTQNGTPIPTGHIYTLAKQHGDNAKHWLNTLNTLRKRGSVVREYLGDNLTPHYRISAKEKRRTIVTGDLKLQGLPAEDTNSENKP